VARLVYSSGPEGESKGRSGKCPSCRADPCRCAPVAVVSPASHAVRVRRERSGRKGKTVTVAAPFFLNKEVARNLLSELKRSCGSGGTLKQAKAPDGRECFSLEIQGDHVDAITDRLAQAGYPAKRAGG
jgi:translation initiation factor 1